VDGPRRGPALVAAYGGEILFAVSDVEPTSDDVGFMLRFDASPLPVASQAKLWARACQGGRYARAVIAPLAGAALENVSPVSSKNFK
jgi:hypothetical protein